MNTVELLDAQAVRSPRTIALAWGAAGAERTMSFRELLERSQLLSGLFAEVGLKRGDAALVFLPMGGTLYSVMAALLRLGVVPVFPDPGRWRPAIEDALARLPVQAFIGTPAACILRWLTPTMRNIAHTFVAGPTLPGAMSLKQAEHCPPVKQAQACQPSDNALVTFTSGSTGRPKGVLRSHAMLAATHGVLSAHLRLHPGEVQAAFLPFFVFEHLAAGVTSLIPDDAGAADTPRFTRQLQQWNVSGLCASPNVVARLADGCERDGHKMPSLRHVFAGGAPVFPALLDRMAGVAPNAEVCGLYGATEAEPIAIVTQAQWGAPERRVMLAGRGLLVGRPIDQIALRILQPGTAEVVAFGEGEIAVAGGHVSSGYLRAEDNARYKVRLHGELWHRTGDAGYMDERGRLWLVGRCAQQVATRSGAIYPLCVEAALSNTPGVRRATLTENEGYRTLVVEPATGAIDSHAVAREVAWCGAEQVVQLKHIPVDRRHRAKVDRAALATLLQRGKWLQRTDLSSPGATSPAAGEHR